MHLFHGMMIALEALWAHKLKTILTLLGNIVGVMFVMAIVSIMDGAQASIEDAMSGEGSGVFQVAQMNALDILSDFTKYLQSMHNPKITESDLAFLREHVTLAGYMDTSLSVSAEVRNRSLYINSVSIRGRSENYPMLDQWNLADGRHFTGPEVVHRKQVAVVGFEVTNRLFPSIDPIGKEIRISGSPFIIVGILEKKSRTMGGDPNLAVFIPYTALEKIYGSRLSLTIIIKPARLDQASDCVDQTRLSMRILRRLGPKREDNFGIITQANMMNLYNSISSKVFGVLIGLVSISLLVSGIFIMNIMLVSVTERTWEIGIRKALGATRMNILWQFLVEAITLSMAGGVLGIAAGFMIAALLAFFSPLPYAIKAWSVLIGLAVTFAVGVFFGAYPASKAAKLDPIEALRYE
jgi:putative ABC transport system permease protein